MKCIFCEIIKGHSPAYKIWGNKDFIILLDTKPIGKGHILLIPKRHFEDLFLMPKALFGDLFLIVRKVAPILRRISKAKKIGLAVEGFGVPHVHIHLVPINKGNELNPLRARPATARSLARIKLHLTRSLRGLN